MKFNYQARTKEGELQTGTVEAPSKETALSLLHRHGLYVTLLEEKALPFYAKKLKFFEGTSKKDLVLFSRQLAVMFRSKVPLVESLKTLTEQVKKSDFREKILTLMEEVEGGTSFSVSLSRYPKLFSPFFIAIVKSGEASGKLSESLDYLANHLEREYELSGKIKGAMIYPAFILVFALIVVSLMVTFVLPQLTTILKESGQELPFLTKVVIGISDSLRARGLILLLFFSTLLILAFRYIKTPQGKKIFDRFSLKIPLIGDFFKKIYLSRLAENLSTLVSAGLPIATALGIAGDVVGNDIYKNIISKTQAEVKKGESISAVLAAYPAIFPPVFTQMTSVGEKAGTLGSTLMNIVDFYQKEIDRSVSSLLSLIEPMLIVFLGVMVAIFAIAVITPVYQMMGKGV
jgi:type IV pilus assembly protein PilC